jgi:hypothetical protein
MLITSACLNLVEQVIVHVEPMYESLVLSNIHVESVYVLRIKIAIPLDTFQQHLPEMFL